MRVCVYREGGDTDSGSLKNLCVCVCVCVCGTILQYMSSEYIGVELYLKS